MLVVDDSAFMRKVISDFINEDYRLEVIGTARNGADALEKIKQLKPDVITLDVEMPIMNGLECLRHIMEENPLPVVMLSSTTKAGAENTMLAMQYGAIDFIAKPSGAISLDLHKVKEEIVEKVFTASQVNVRAFKDVKKLPPSFHESNKAVVQQRNTESRHTRHIICIGTSTGGPRALQEVLKQIPKTINAPLLIVQHMPPNFTKSLAERLNSLCDIKVKEAEDGELIEKGTAYIAPGGYHLTIRQVGTTLSVKLDKSAPKNGHRPSVDVMFESISKIKGYHAIAVIMTGMGSDGANGLKMLKNHIQTYAIAESQESCVVYGMPKSAIATDLVDNVAHVNEIANAILKYVK